MTELLVILVVGLLVLGPKRLPELARSLGRGLAEFRRASSDMRREFLDVTEEVQRTDPGLDAADATDPPDESPPRLDEPKSGPESEPADAGTKTTDPIAGTKGG